MDVNGNIIVLIYVVQGGMQSSVEDVLMVFDGVVIIVGCCMDKVEG